ncbi:MAG: hypothetical protein ACRD96_14995, partial [Bryobacteraceae bacterium]
LGHSNITPQGLRILGSLEKVERLGLEGCRRIDDSAAVELGTWKALKYLDIQDTQVTAEGLEALRRIRPDLSILATSRAPATP